jgi:hypothetical protein
MNTKQSEARKALERIYESLRRADRIIARWEFEGGEPKDEQVSDYYIEAAFVRSILLFEFLGLTRALEAVIKLREEASEDYSKTEHFEDLFSYWGSKLRLYLEALEPIVGVSDEGVVTKQLLDILRATEYAVTQKVFGEAPSKEKEVQDRIELILKCVYPDVISQPSLTKPIKNFRADTGIASTRTLIEYKYINTIDRAKMIADQILADSRGYTDSDWDNFIFVIYETKRIFPEQDWKRLLIASGVDSTDIVVLCGEPAAAGGGEGKLPPKS